MTGQSLGRATPRGAGPFPWSRGSVLNDTENGAVGRAIPWTPKAAHSVLENQGQWLWLISLPRSPPRRLQPRSLKRKAIWRLSKRTAFTFRERAGEDCFQVALQGPSQRGWGQGWARRCGQWPGERAERLPLPGGAFPQRCRRCQVLARSQLRGPLLPCPVASHRTSLRT